MKTLKLGFALGAAMLATLGTANAQQVVKVGGMASDLAAVPGALIAAIAKDAGFDITLQPFSGADGTIAALTSDQIEIGFVGAVTEERKKLIDFSRPYDTAPEGLVVLKSDTTAYRAWADFRGTAVGTLAGSRFPDALQASGIFSQVKQYATRADLLRAVSSGEVKLAVGAPQSQAALIDQGFADLRPVATYEPVMVSQIAIAVSKKNAVLLGKVNGSLNKLMIDGTVKAIYAKYGQDWSAPK